MEKWEHVPSSRRGGGYLVYSVEVNVLRLVSCYIGAGLGREAPEH